MSVTRKARKPSRATSRRTSVRNAAPVRRKRRKPVKPAWTFVALERHNKTPLYVNPAHVTAIFQGDHGGTIVRVIGSKGFTVAEPPQAVVMALLPKPKAKGKSLALIEHAAFAAE